MLKTNLLRSFLSLSLLGACVVSNNGCAKNGEPLNTALPENWYSLPEYRPGLTGDQLTQELNSSSITLSDDASNSIDQLFKADAEALESTSNELEAKQGSPSTPAMAPAAAMTPSNFVPWHAEYFLTDFAVNLQGLFGGLVLKGTPTVTAIWRKHHNASATSLTTAAKTDLPPTNGEAEEPVATLNLTEGMSDVQIDSDLEPLVSAAVATGKIKSKTALKAHLLSRAKVFQSLVEGVPQNPGNQWWVSRIRMDLTADATGTVSPVHTVAGEVKLRIEWHRVMSSSHQAHRRPNRQNAAVNKSMREFVEHTAEDLQEISFESVQKRGFVPYQFYVGVGFAMSTNIAIVQSSGSCIARIYFARDISKPTTEPKSAGDNETLNLIDTSANADRIKFADDFKIEHETSPPSTAPTATSSTSGVKEVVYKVSRKNFKRGLKRAAKMGAFFAKNAAKAHALGWQIYELRTTFDMSITGDSKLTALGGAGTAEIDFYNKRF